MRYVLIVQFPETYFASHAELSAFEQRLVACMPRTCEVDGHDIGSGTTNFFVFTRAPLAAHRAFRKYLGTRAVERHLRIAFRPVDGQDYPNIWPFRDARPFALMYAPHDDPFRPASKREIPKRSKPGVSKLLTRAQTPNDKTSTLPAKTSTKRSAKTSTKTSVKRSAKPFAKTSTKRSAKTSRRAR